METLRIVEVSVFPVVIGEVEGMTPKTGRVSLEVQKIPVTTSETSGNR